MKISSFETLTELNAIIGMLGNVGDSSLTSAILVGASTTVGKSLTEWYWQNSGKKVSFTIPFGVGEPNFANNKEFCLSLRKDTSNFYKFNDITCDESNMPFICQKTEYLIPLN